MPGNNMVYLSGIHSHISERPILLFLFADQPPAIIIPTLEAMKAEDAGVAPERIFGLGPMSMGIAQHLHEPPTRCNSMVAYWAWKPRRCACWNTKHCSRLPRSWCWNTPMACCLLCVCAKMPVRLPRCCKAVAVAEDAIEALLPQIKIGMTEREVAGKLVLALVDGADAPAFSPIVSTGPNAASPHAVPTDRPLQSGDLLVIDWAPKSTITPPTSPAPTLSATSTREAVPITPRCNLPMRRCRRITTRSQRSGY